MASQAGHVDKNIHWAFATSGSLIMVMLRIHVITFRCLTSFSLIDFNTCDDQQDCRYLQEELLANFGMFYFQVQVITTSNGQCSLFLAMKIEHIEQFTHTISSI